MVVRFVAGALAIPALITMYGAARATEPATRLATAPQGVPQAAPGAGQKSPPPSLGELAFMAGCWRGHGSNAATTIEETYTPPTDNMIIGMTRYVRGGRVVDFEFTTIERSDTALVLLPRPKGVRSVSFSLKELADGKAVWENPTHDFPQRIVYQRTAEGTLVARIEGTTSRGPRHMEWTMTRCESAAK